MGFAMLEIDTSDLPKNLQNVADYKPNIKYHYKFARKSPVIFGLALNRDCLAKKQECFKKNLKIFEEKQNYQNIMFYNGQIFFY
jgi:hypothetical protein